MRKLITFLVVIALATAAGYGLWHGFLREQWLLFRYPVEYSAAVEDAAAEFDVPKELIYAVIHTESGFRADARSRAGAKGLMQIIDSTNVWIAQKMGEEAVENDVFVPGINIRRGTWYLAYLHRQFGTWREAVAAYNAGYGRVKGWLDDRAYSADGMTLTQIPIKETREYVERVFRARDIYAELYFDKN